MVKSARPYLFSFRFENVTKKTIFFHKTMAIGNLAWPTKYSINWLTDQWIDQPKDRPTNWLINRRTHTLTEVHGHNQKDIPHFLAIHMLDMFIFIDTKLSLSNAILDLNFPPDSERTSVSDVFSSVQKFYDALSNFRMPHVKEGT